MATHSYCLRSRISKQPSDSGRPPRSGQPHTQRQSSVAAGLWTELIVPPEDHFPPLTDDDSVQIQILLMEENKKKVVITKFRLTITVDDLCRLNWTIASRNNGDDWLNDRIVDFYMKMIMAQRQINADLPKVYALDAHFHVVYRNEGYNGVWRWTNDVDLFDMDVVFIPWMWRENHWLMVIVDFRDQTIEVYDSMSRRRRHTDTGHLVMEYLRAEHSFRKGVKMVVDGWGQAYSKEVQQVDNDSDCGVFCCMKARVVSLRKQIVLKQKYMPYCRQLMVWEIVNGRLME